MSLTAHPKATHWLILADVEGLKAINDTHGHQTGDSILRAVEAAMERPEATVGRYGGDEFVAYLVDGKREVGEAYCRAVEALLSENTITDFRLKKKVLPTVTMGMAGYPEDATSIEGLIRIADRQMYAKRSDRVIRDAGRGAVA